MTGHPLHRLLLEASTVVGKHCFKLSLLKRGDKRERIASLLDPTPGNDLQLLLCAWGRIRLGVILEDEDALEQR